MKEIEFRILKSLSHYTRENYGINSSISVPHYKMQLQFKLEEQSNWTSVPVIINAHTHSTNLSSHVHTQNEIYGWE